VRVRFGDPEHRQPGWRRFVALLGRPLVGAALAILLLVACRDGPATATAPSSTTAPRVAPTVVPTATVAPPTVVVTAIPEIGTPTAVPSTPTVAPNTPTVRPAPSPTSVDPAQASLDAGNTDLRAGNAAAAVHDYAIARLLSPQRADIAAALATAEALLSSGQANRSGPPATPTPVPSLPTRLIIPAIGVNAAVEHIGLATDGGMDVPKQWADVAWFDEGPAPGQAGNATIDGHLDSTTAPAVFWRLGALKPGDQVLVVLANEQTIAFNVRAMAHYPYNQAPLQQIFGPSTSINLNLITCGGSWDAFTKNYSERVVAYTSKA
jgi:sortase A